MERPSRVHWFSWLFVIAMSLALQFAVPVVSDEAYFISWGQSWHWGVYDHPPLPAWVSFALWKFESLAGLTNHGLFHRLLAPVLGVVALLLLAFRLRSMHAPIGAGLIAVAMVPGYLLLFNLYLNDTILAFLSLIFLLSVEQAFRAERNITLAILLAACAFGLVLLTKYNGAVVFLGMILAFLSWQDARRFLVTRFFVIALIALVPFAWHLWWNYQNCGVNLAFNFEFRKTAATGFGPLWVLATAVIMTGSIGFFVLLGLRRAIFIGFFTRVFLGTIVIILAISVLRGEFGVNWGAPLGFLAVLALAESNPKALDISQKVSLLLSFVMLVPLVGALALLRTGAMPVEAIASDREGFTARMLFDIDEGELPDALGQLSGDLPVAVLEYGVGASLINAGFDRVLVFSKSIYGRNQDLTVDFSLYDGADIVVLAPSRGGEARLAVELFDSAEFHRIETDRQSYQVILGKGFRFDAYRTNWILPVLTGLYDASRIPHGNCFMSIYY